MLPELSIPAAGQKDRRLWGRECGTSGQIQYRKSAIDELLVILRMIRIKSDKSDWFWSQSIVFTKQFKTAISLDLVRGCDSWCFTKRSVASRDENAMFINIDVILRRAHFSG